MRTMDYLWPVLFVGYVVVTEIRLYRLKAENRRLRRIIGAAIVVLLMSGEAFAFPMPSAKRVTRTTQEHPDNAIIEALVFLETKINPDDWCYYQFFSDLEDSDTDVPGTILDFRAALQLVSTGPSVYDPIPIDKAARVYAVDIRRLGWNRPAVQAVTAIEPFFRQPHINPQLAKELRRAVGADLNKETFHCEGLIPIRWFLRELIETDRHRDDPENIVYYNLLYASERFGRFDNHSKSPTLSRERVDAAADPGPEPALPKRLIYRANSGPWLDGRVYPYDFEYFRETQEQIDQIKKDREAWRAAKARFRDSQNQRDSRPSPTVSGTHRPVRIKEAIDRDFPRNADDFLAKWGAKASEDFLAKEYFYKKNGTVIAGFRNNPKAGSIVSYNDRVNEFLNTPLGLQMRTRDFFITSKRRNVANQPLQVALGEIDEDASEHIAQMPNDFPAFLLTGGAKAGRKRAEFGDPHAVRNSADPHSVLVLTMGTCIGCHYPSDVVLAPSNQKILASLKRRNELLAYTPEEVDIIDQFFHANDAAGSQWLWKLGHWREPFSRSLAVATRTVAQPKGLTGSAWAVLLVNKRNHYDEPVTFDKACAELGYPRLAVMIALSQLGSFDAQDLFLDREDGISRDVWDNDLFPQVAGLLAFMRDAEFGDPFLLTFYPDLVRDARVKLYEMKGKSK